MNNNNLYNLAYDILVNFGCAIEEDRRYFIYAHVRDEPCLEWRFQGCLGFGGKFRSRTFTVDCYPEDETPERLKIIKKINEELNDLR